MSTSHCIAGKGDFVCSRIRGNANCYSRCALSREFTVLYRYIVRIVVLAGCVRFAGCLCARNINECIVIVVCLCIICELQVIDRQCVSPVVSAIAVDVDLSCQGLGSTIQGKIESILLMDDNDILNIRKECNSNITTHLMRCINCFLQCEILRVANRSHTLLGRCAVRKHPINIDFDFAAVQCTANDSVIDLHQTADHSQLVRFRFGREVLIDRVVI